MSGVTFNLTGTVTGRMSSGPKAPLGWYPFGCVGEEALPEHALPGIPCLYRRAYSPGSIPKSGIKPVQLFVPGAWVPVVRALDALRWHPADAGCTNGCLRHLADLQTLLRGIGPDRLRIIASGGPEAVVALWDALRGRETAP